MDTVATFARYLASAYGLPFVPTLQWGGHGMSDAMLATSALETVPHLIQSKNRDLSGLYSAGVPVAFSGEADGEALAILDGCDCKYDLAQHAPQSFTVLAIVPAYNEADIIVGTLKDILAQGMEPYVIDNGSTDGTYELAKLFEGRGLRGLERFPPKGPVETFDLQRLLSRVEECAATQPADWVVLHDADERRRSPWPGVSVRDALWHAGQCGFSCVDHVTLTFWPVDNDYDPVEADLEDHFRFFEFSTHPGHFHQRRAWRSDVGPVSLSPSAGHDVTFGGRRVYPYKFLLKHYPIRSQAHGERKILRDRASRWNAAERKKGWHQQYDGLGDGQFLRDPATLIRYDDTQFNQHYLIPRLSGVGVFETPPSWATAPAW